MTCARVRVGALTATGLGVVPVRSATRLWGEAVSCVRARVDLFGPIFVEAEGGAAAVVTRDRFFVEPDHTVHRAPAAARRRCDRRWRVVSVIAARCRTFP